MILLGLLMIFAPRLALFLVWVLTPLVNRAFGTFIIPLLGFFFLPLTTLVFSLVYVPAAGAPTGLGWLWVGLAAIADIAAYGAAARGNRGAADAGSDMDQEHRRAA